MLLAVTSLTIQDQRLKGSVTSGHGAALRVVRGDTKEKTGYYGSLRSGSH